ncbi:MAG: hypothetical protein L0G69_14175 [Brevibacterium sp.]|uniref:hypothetical protein n=1 Tax=Brevibacterium sandarakinum TaxID=629680 RepID=UPI00264E6F41|nr:hypothetical protein [Brevibacterium sandarakinum]MDN5587699.1 hypothetical protein [Brevibacterium sp.]MDN5634247.1 hypothetical protein [Brevibacterium sp.]MDN5656456.1 hypothetical protein [Brevibacterium sandarakinum]
MPTHPGWFRTIYGARPRHLLVLTACFLLAGFAVLVRGLDQLFDPDVWWQSPAVWFLGGAVFVDLVLLPLCALADRALAVVLPAERTSLKRGLRIPIVNYIRVPVLASGLLFLLFFPGIVEQGRSSYLAATGQTQEPFLGRWLWLTALFCCLSILAFAVRCCARRLRTKRSIERERDD